MTRRYFPPEVTRARANELTTRARLRNHMLAWWFEHLHPTSYGASLERVDQTILQQRGPLPGDEDEQ